MFLFFIFHRSRQALFISGCGLEMLVFENARFDTRVSFFSRCVFAHLSSSELYHMGRVFLTYY